VTNCLQVVELEHVKAHAARHLADLAVQLSRAQDHYMTPTVSGPDLDAAHERMNDLQRQYEAALQAYAPFVKEEP
jgi:hypothetical protein